VNYPGLLAVPMLALAIWLHARIEDRIGTGPQHESLYLWSGEHVRRLFPGLEGLVADVYWLRSVQYFGSRHTFAQDNQMPLLGALLDITVTLDPRMEVAYRYGATFLAEPVPLGAGRPREAVALLARGASALPENWRIRQDLGFFYFLHLGDYRRAAEVLLEASTLPGAAFWLKNMAADIVARGGDRATARRMWQQIAEQSEGLVRANAVVHVQVLDALEQADRLSRLVETFTRQMGRRPRSLQELGAHFGVRTVDSSGVPFVYDAETGRVHVSPHSTLHRPDRESP
jgi:hypothetical protein